MGDTVDPITREAVWVLVFGGVLVGVIIGLALDVWLYRWVHAVA